MIQNATVIQILDRRGLIASFIILALSIPALIGA